MISINKQWENMKAEYLHKVQKALSSVKHPRSREILDDVGSHLDRRFAELETSQKTPENLHNIIKDMGPASEYVELLEPQVGLKKQISRRNYILAFSLALVIIIVGIFFLTNNPMKVQPVIFGQGRLEDKIDYPFINDPAVIGAWKSVDFVKSKNDFNPNKKSWKGKLWLNHLVFEEDGNIKDGLQTWTKGLIINDRAKTASTYEIKEIDGSKYMFFEWKSGDYTIRHQPPAYYVLKEISIESVKFEPMFGEKADIPPTSIIDENGHIVDKVDYPFVNDPEALGAWESVDFVENIEDFNPENINFNSDLFLKELFILEDGKTNWLFTWTNGLILSEDTASKYIIKDISGAKYMFFEWKSGDYTNRRMKPSFYVLKQIPGKVYVESRTIDKIDYPFVDDPNVIGTWISVDYVDEPEQFYPDRRRWRAGDLFLKELVFLPEGKMENSNDTWTKGLVLDLKNKTASRYIIREIDGTIYMFYEWKSGDYIFRGENPYYYVLKKE
jgi:hypothetical protein